MQAYDSVMCGYFFIWFIDFMLKGKSLTDFKNRFSPNNFQKFDKSLIVFYATSGRISVVSFATIIGAPVEIASATFSLAYSLTTGIVKKLLKTRRNKKKKHKQNCYVS